MVINWNNDSSTMHGMAEIVLVSTVLEVPKTGAQGLLWVSQGLAGILSITRTYYFTH